MTFVSMTFVLNISVLITFVLIGLVLMTLRVKVNKTEVIFRCLLEQRPFKKSRSNKYIRTKTNRTKPLEQ